MRARNAIVAQSGGPSPVINASLRGVAETCRAFPGTFGTLYAGYHGIEGVLKEELLDLSAQPDEEIALLVRTLKGYRIKFFTEIKYSLEQYFNSIYKKEAADVQ